MSEYTVESEGEGSPSALAEGSLFAELLGTSGRAKMIDVFLSKHDAELTAPEVAEFAGIATSTVNRNIDAFIDIGLIERTREVGGTALYRLDAESDLAKALGAVRDELLARADRLERLENDGDDVPDLREPETRRKVLEEMYVVLLEEEVLPRAEEGSGRDAVVEAEAEILERFEDRKLQSMAREAWRAVDDADDREAAESAFYERVSRSILEAYVRAEADHDDAADESDPLDEGDERLATVFDDLFVG